MSVRSRQEYTRQVSKRYVDANRKEKSRILDEFVMTSGYNRKYALTLLNSPPQPRTQPIRRPRSRIYSSEVKKALLLVWQASHGLCGKRLAPYVGPMVEALVRAGEIELVPSVRDRLVKISASTIDRLLKEEKQLPIRGRTLTKPGTLLRRQIPVRTFADWHESEHRPGFCEVDLVAHCAENTAGDFLYTLTLTDVFTGWTLPIALANRSQETVHLAIKKARALLPFPLLGLDSDNGTEFINHLLNRYCQAEKITFTRCRPYKKNDQCRVEQKNWSVVRQYVGYQRLEGEAALNCLNQVYAPLRLHVNYFQPSLKLVSKERDRAKVLKRYDTAKTPYQRLLAAGQLAEHRQAQLKELYLSLNPLDLTRQIQAALDELGDPKVRFFDEATKAA